MRVRLALATLLLTSLAGPAMASVLIRVDKSTQRMAVSVDGVPTYDFPVSTGIAKYDTPNVSAVPNRMEREHFSKEWDDAPMPFAMFFTDKGHAIHGSGHVSKLGQPASHGCVRLSVKNAEKLFELVKVEGRANTRIVVEGSIPATAPAVAKRAPRRPAYDPYAEDGYGYTAYRPAPRREVMRTYEPFADYRSAPVRGYGYGYGRSYGYGAYDDFEGY